MNLLSFIPPIRTSQPCSGVGRPANNVLLRLAEREGIRQQLFFAAEWLQEDGMPDPPPLHCETCRTRFPAGVLKHANLSSY